MSVEKKKGAFLPKIGNAFGNDAFGEGSIKVDITAEGLDAIMKNLQVGSAILFKFNKVTSKGNPHYFAEILPPFERTKAKPVQVKSVETNTDLD